MRRNFAYSEADGHIYAGSAAWRTLNTLEMEIRRMDGLSGGRMIVRFQKENLLLEAEDTLISVGGLGISPRQALTVFGIKKIKQIEREKTGGIFRRFFHNSVKIL